MSMNDPADALGELVRGIRRVVLLDIEMPGTNGLELLRQIKEHDDGIQVIMLSGKMGSVLQSVDDGAEVCFFKPLDNIELMLDALDEAFQKLDPCLESPEDLA
jgi:DNA-binding NtrC family response regulator